MQPVNNLKVASLGSGSKGNATIVSNGESTVMVDCGFTIKETLKRLQTLELDAHSIDAILVTHEHQDHISGVGPLSRKFNIPVWATRGSILSGKCGALSQLHYISGFKDFSVGSLTIVPLPVPHDAREPCQFLFKHQQQHLAILTDLGSFTPEIIEQLKSCNGLLLECNHDEQMLWDGVYPERLKRRVAGQYGHMSNKQAVDLLTKLNKNQLQLLIASHLSEKNNCPILVRESLAKAMSWPEQKILIAEQDQGFSWQEITQNLQ